MKTIFVEVTIVYKDDKVEKFESCDTPYLGAEWVTLYPRNEPLSRKMVAREKIDNISWKYRV